MRRLLAAAVVLPLLAGCSRHEQCAGAADCPLTVSFEGRDYLVSCAVVPRLLVGDALDVTSEEERKLGPGYGVDGYELEGVDRAEAVVIRFAQRHCGDRAFHVAFGKDVPEARLKAIDRILRRRRPW